MHCTHTDEILDFQLQQSISKLARVNISITTRKVLEKPRHVEKKVTTKEEITLLFIKWLLWLVVVVLLLAINLSLKTADAEPASSFVVVVNNIFVFWSTVWGFWQNARSRYIATFVRSEYASKILRPIHQLLHSPAVRPRGSGINYPLISAEIDLILDSLLPFAGDNTCCCFWLTCRCLLLVATGIVRFIWPHFVSSIFFEGANVCTRLVFSFNF